MDPSALILKFRYPLLLLLVGLILGGFGFLLYQTTSETKVEILESNQDIKDGDQITVEASGAFEKPGVYKLASGSRVEDLFILAGGVSAAASREWIERSVNRAAKLTDGQKVFVPNQSEVLSANIGGPDQSVTSDISSQGSGLTNINTASKSQLEDLPGIGPVYAQSIIDHRPYSDASELVSKDAIKQGVYKKIKDRVTVY